MNAASAVRNPENLVFRSRIEIRRILQTLAEETGRVTADLADGRMFISHILSASARSDQFTVAYCKSRSINAKVLESPSLEFTATTRRGVNFSFEASGPEEIVLDGRPAISFSLPRAVLLHDRREHPRIPAPAEVSLRCIADEKGVIPFESHITDVSHDGLGCLVYEPGVRLEDGTVLRGCRIVLPDGDTVTADLRLRHATTVTLADGTLVMRAGFRFMRKTVELGKVLDYFVRELGE
jgi:c-di-GMP-binding flagellar brake protein YcgR